MSTLPGQASKGEKTKPKFQSLDINSLYRVSRGENPEKQQQKSSLTYIKHGMQLLGKVPSARRAPANLPSLKAEHSGTDAAVPLVPPGAQGWGKQDTSQASSGASPAQQQQQQHQQPQQQQQMGTPTAQNNAGPQQQQLTSHQAAIALPVTTTIPPHSHKQLTPTAQVAPSSDKLWSTVMGGQEAPQPPLYQSPQFQHEFPSLSAGDGGPTRTGSDAPPYPSGLSLRPQTEGSWTQGGQRVGGAGGGGIEGGLRAPGPPGGPPQLPAQVGMQAGQQQPFPPQIRGVMPPFMCKGNAFQQQAPGLQNNMNTPSPVNGRGGTNRPPPPRLADHRDIDEVTPRPIIREEELSMMDEIGKDMGWAESDEIDYNQKLAFSDEESEKPSKKDAGRRQHHQQQLQMQQQHQIQQQQQQHQQQLQQQHQMQQQQQHQVQQQQQQHQVQQQQHQVQQQQQHPVQQQPQPHQVQQHAQQQQHQHPPQNRDHNREERNDAHPVDSQQQQRQWSSSRSSTSRGRSSEDEDLWVQQRWSQTEKEVDMAVQRAKQRKEEEEKRFNEERKQGAAKKLLELEEKIQKRDRDNHEGVGTINPSSVPPKPINHVDIPLPDFQKEKERDRSRTPNEVVEEKNPPNNQGNSFRHLTQIEGKNFPRKHQKQSERERDRDREQGAPSFSRHFQNDLPPRFLKHQRNNSNPNLQTQQPYHQFDNRWLGGAQNAPPKSQQQQQNPPHNARNTRLDSPEVEKEGEVEDRREYKRQGSDDSYRSSHHSQDLQKISETRFQDNVASRNQSFDSQYSRREPDEDKWQLEKDSELQPRQVSDMDWNDKRDKTRDEKSALPLERYDSNVRESRGDRPQRPDSRDSRSSRHQRDNEPQSQRDYIGQWSDPAPSSLSAHYDLPPPAPFEENKRREDRRTVPGPITKERIEADDARGEKRGLTQLKRGHAMETVRKEEVKETEVKKEQSIGAWADCIPSGGEEMEEKKLQDSHRSEQKSFMDQTKKSDDYSQNRNRPYSQKKGWGNVPNDYHSSRSQGWQKRSSSRGHKKSNKDYHTTDSDASVEDHTGEQKIEKLDSRDQKSPKPGKKLEKEEKNRENKQEKYVGEQKKFDKSERKDNYVPRGEPSRHGRGGGNFRSSRMSGLSKRIDGYGPPPSKSPFGHHDDKDKKFVNEDVQRVEAPAPVEDKTKQNQQALAAGIIGKRTNEPVSMFEDKNKGSRSKLDPRKPKSKGREDGCDMNSDHSDDRNKDLRKVQGKPQGSRPQQTMNRGRNNPPPRLGGDKRGSYESSRQNSSNAIKKDEKLIDQNVLANAIADISLKNRDEGGDTGDKEEKVSVNGDLEGFQEVKSKKMVKERQKSAEDKSATKGAMKSEPKELSKDRERKSKSAAQQLTQQQIQNIPPLMATPVNPPPVLPINNKNQFDRPRQSKLAPRFAKQKLQKAQMQQQHPSFCGDVNDMNKVNQNINASYVIKDAGGAPPPVSSCAWDKPLGSQLRNMEHDTMLGVAIDNVKVLDSNQTASQGTSPNNEKMLSKPTQLQEKALLDGTTPPVNTIIFENTNFKSAPGSRNSRNDKPRAKLEDPTMDSSVMAGFNKPTMNELLQNKNDGKSETIQLPLFKEDTADMKLDFFGTDLQFTDEKTAKNLCMSKSIHAITSGNNTVDSLDFKIASVKKVWETSEQEGEDNQISFGGPPLDSNVFNQGKDTPDDNHEGYSPSPNQTASTTTNVCKVKPTQQVSGSGQTVLSSSSHQQHSGIVAPGLMGNPLSPPPMPTVLGASVGIGPQQYAASHNIGYQAGLSGSTQYGISAIPSPPTVPLVYSQTQQLQAAAAQTASLYGAFQIDQSGVLGGQGRSQFSTYPNYHHHAASLGQTASSPYTTHQSVYLQTAPTHPPPPTAQPPPPPELYTGIGGYRLSAAAAAAPFAQSQQLNNPTTVLISSTSGNSSLMSAATVKGGSQAISAIGTKAGGVGQAYQQQPQSAAQQQQQQQQGQQQVYMAFDPSMQANYLAAAAAAAASPGAAMQRGPAAPVQNNVVAGLQPSSSYYSGSTGGQTGYFQQPGNSTMPSAQLQQHQAGYGLQGNVFGTHSQSHTNTGLQNYNSHFLTTSMQMAAALSAQQFRSAYMKGVGSQQIGDQSGRPQQLKSPSNQEVLSSVFNSGPQIPSPKSRQNCKHPPPQSSPTAQQKYNLYQGVGGQQNPNIQRYPTPIQRPVNFQQMQQNNNVNQKHRGNPNNKAPNRHYYGGQNNSLSVQNEKAEESKMNDGVLSNANSPNVTSKAAMGPNSTSNVNTSAEKVKDNKEEAATLKD